jgi:hypothetical protein
VVSVPLRRRWDGAVGVTFARGGDVLLHVVEQAMDPKRRAITYGYYNRLGLIINLIMII